MFLLEFPQFFVDSLDGEAHDVVVGAADAGDADVAYPFLNAVGAGFVEGLILTDIVGYLFIGEFLEGDVGADGAADGLVALEEAVAGIYLVRLAAEFAQHGAGIISIARLAENLAVADDNGVGR